MAEPQINVESSVAAGASMSVSQAELFFTRCKHGNENERRIAGDSATKRKKLTARQWATLIGFFEFKPGNRFKTNWKQIEKARDSTEVRIIVVIKIKEQQVDIDIHSIQEWFGPTE